MEPEAHTGAFLATGRGSQSLRISNQLPSKLGRQTSEPGSSHRSGSQGQVEGSRVARKAPVESELEQK